MYKVCKTEKPAIRQKLIEQTLLEFMKQKPYDAITVTELCDKLKMPRKAFYRYFDGKDDALRGLVDHTLSEFHSQESEMGTPRSLHRELGEFFVFWHERREFLRALSENGLIGILYQASVSFPVGNMINLQRLLPDEESDAVRVAVFKFAIGGLMSVMLEWFKNDFRTSVPDVVRIAVRILSRPPFPNLGRIGMSVLPTL